MFKEDLIDYNDNIYNSALSDIIKQIKDEIPYINRKIMDIDWSKKYDYQGDINEINFGFDYNKNQLTLNPSYTYVGETPKTESLNELNKILKDYLNELINKISYNKVDKMELKIISKNITAKINDNITKLFIRLNVYLYNFHTLHWFIKDLNFDELHELMNEYYDKIFDDIDTVAEYMISENIPIPNLKQIADSDVDLLSTDIDYDEEMVNNAIINYFQSILDTINNCYAEVDNPGFKSELDAMYYYYDKEVNYKARRRR